jgi:exopolysaccharide biosynthesis polyprenyl glycosylphosphotransferase
MSSADIVDPMSGPLAHGVAPKTGIVSDDRLTGWASEAVPFRRPTRQLYRFVYAAMAFTDALVAAIAMVLASQVRFGVRAPSPHLIIWAAVSGAVTVAIFASLRLYSVHLFSAGEEFRRTLLGVSMATIGLAEYFYWSRASLPRGLVGLSWILSLALILLTRCLWHSFLQRARSRGRLTLRTLIVGRNDEAIRLATAMQARSLGFAPLGFVATGDPPSDSPSHSDRPVICELRNLREGIRRTRAECVFVASTAAGPSEMAAISNAVRLESVDCRVTSNLPEVLSTRLSIQPIGGAMALSLFPVRLSGAQAAAKRALDLVLSTLGIIMTAPLWAGIAILIRLTSRGPVLYRQTRVGRGGQPFGLMKFRTMVPRAEAMRASLMSRNESTGPLFKIREDPRITTVGRWLRRWSLDELPQLLNVFRGDMSLVGPRPPLPEEVKQYNARQHARLEVRPGITGLWQVSGRSLLPFDDYIRLDLFYIGNWSIAYDLLILAKTIPAVLFGRGAR